MNDDLLPQLRERWAPSWIVWRAQRSGDAPGRRTGDYYASRIDDAAGIDPTVAASTPEALDALLAAQAAAVAHGRRPAEIHERWLT